MGCEYSNIDHDTQIDREFLLLRYAYFNELPVHA